MLRVTRGGPTRHLKSMHVQHGIKVNLIHSSRRLEMPTHRTACNLVHVKRQRVSQHPHVPLIM